MQETWDLYCPIDGIDKPGGLNPFTDFDNYQFRFARRDGLLDTEVITCDLLRTADEQNKVLQGYDITIWVVDYYEGVDYWRGVDRCEAKFIWEPIWSEDSCRETFNVNTARPQCRCVGDPCVYRERITFKRLDSASGTNVVIILVIFVVALLGCAWGVAAYYLGRCGQWCDVTGGVKWCDFGVL